jgi:hypothetical protein
MRIGHIPRQLKHFIIPAAPVSRQTIRARNSWIPRWSCAAVAHRAPLKSCRHADSRPEPGLHLAAQIGHLAQQPFDIEFVLEIDLEVGIGARANLQPLAILAHHDQRSLQADEDAEEQVEQLVRIGIRRRPESNE